MSHSQATLKYTLASFLLILITAVAFAQKSVEVWITNADRSSLFQKQANVPFSAVKNWGGPDITIDDKKTYQTIDGGINRANH